MKRVAIFALLVALCVSLPAQTTSKLDTALFSAEALAHTMDFATTYQKLS